MKRLQRKVLALFARVERAAAWSLMMAGAATFVSVLVGLVVVGDAKWATLLVAADLVVTGFSAVQEAESDDGESG